MHKILRVLGLKWSENLEYRGDIILWTIADALVPIVALTIWYTVSLSSKQGFPPQEILTYYIFAIFVRAITTAWGGYFLAGEILKGEIVKYLVRPLSVFWIHAAENITVKVLRLILPLVVLGLILWLKPHFFWPTVYDPRTIAFFAISTILAAILLFIFDMVSAMLAFWLEDVMQIREYQSMLYEIASGTLIPLAFLPHFAQKLFNFLPFKYTLSTPLEILLGRLSPFEIWQQLGIQLIWITVCTTAITVLWKKGLKIYAVPGQ